MVHNFREHWRKIEKTGIYIILAAFVVANWAKLFFPGLNGILGSGITTAILATLIFAVFRLFEQRLERPGVNAFGALFFAATDSLLPTRKRVDSLDLWAHTGSKYYSVITNKDLHIRHMRILLPSVDQLLHGPTILANLAKRDEIVQERNLIIRQWEDLVEKGLIEELTIREYAWVSEFHFMIVNGNAAQFGFFQLPSKPSGSRVPRNYTARTGDGVGSEIVNDFTKIFEDVFANFSKPTEHTSRVETAS